MSDSDVEGEKSEPSPTTPAEGGDEDWNVDEYRGDHESDEHWELRRAFMLKNKGLFPKDRLVCLGQVFSNHEFMGCRYPQETMDLVAELSAGVVEEYRQKQQKRLQRTFVKASDAAEKKSKGTKRSSNSSAPGNKICFSEATESKSQSSSSSNQFNLATNFCNEGLNQNEEELKGVVIVNQLYLRNDSPIQILTRSCSMSQKPCVFELDQTDDGNTYTTKCTVRIGNIFVAENICTSKDMAKTNAAILALERLKKICYTIEIKCPFVSPTEFGKSHISGLQTASTPLKDDNIGNKLMKLMGWGGGGLGKNQQGMTNPIETPEVIGRSRLGIGLSASTGVSGAAFAAVIKKFLQNQMWQFDQFDVQFTSEFSSDERKIIHQIASHLHLKSRSYGKGEERFLVISRKIHLKDLVQEIINTGENAKYRIIEPEPDSSSTSFNNNYSENTS